jgi:hypothetical protein
MNELRALDEVIVRMTLRTATQTRIAMAFEYLRRTDRGDEILARVSRRQRVLGRSPTALSR